MFDPDSQSPRAIAIAAFGGWNDAGTASSLALAHLINTWGIDDETEPHEIDPNVYMDFHVNRPILTRTDEGHRKIVWPRTSIVTLSHTEDVKATIVEGPEPALNWRGYCTEILDELEKRGITYLVTLGALLADVPHSRPLPLSVSIHRPNEREVVSDGGYEGPIGIPTVLSDMAEARGFTTLSMWVQVPSYIGENPSPKAALALVEALEEHLCISIPLGDLSEDSEAWERGMDALAAHDDELTEYVKQLENMHDTADLPEASGDAIASEFERFLRRRESGPQ